MVPWRRMRFLTVGLIRNLTAPIVPRGILVAAAEPGEEGSAAGIPVVAVIALVTLDTKRSIRG